MISSEFIEEDFISALNAVLSHFKHYKLRIDRISQSEENQKGYDGILKIKKPIFIQFKRSDYYPRTYKGKLREDRYSFDFSKGKSFYSFKLLKSRHNGYYKQHNLLYHLSKKNEAYYFAPLFWKKKDLEIFNFKFYSKLPDIIELSIFERIVHSSYLYKIPFMIKNTIGIKPHREISCNNNESHCYTYDKAYNVVFHSDPEKVNSSNIFKLNHLFDIWRKSLEENNFDEVNFLDIIKDINTFLEKEKLNMLDELKEYYNYYYNENIVDSTSLTKLSNTELGILLENYLRDNFNIHLYGIYSD